MFNSDFSMEVAAFLQHANRSLLQILSPCFNLRTVHVTTQSRIVSGRVNGLILHSALNRKCVCVWQMFDGDPFPFSSSNGAACLSSFSVLLKAKRFSVYLLNIFVLFF